MTSLDKLREMLRSGALYGNPKPEATQEPEAAESHTEASQEPLAGDPLASNREKMCRMKAKGAPIKGVMTQKVYILSLTSPSAINGQHTWEVWAAWGRVGNALNEKCLLSTTVKSKALKLYRAKMAEKLDKGYNIESQTGAE